MQPSLDRRKQKRLYNRVLKQCRRLIKAGAPLSQEMIAELGHVPSGYERADDNLSDFWLKRTA